MREALPWAPGLRQVPEPLPWALERQLAQVPVVPPLQLVQVPVAPPLQVELVQVPVAPPVQLEQVPGAQALRQAWGLLPLQRKLGGSLPGAPLPGRAPQARG